MIEVNFFEKKAKNVLPQLMVLFFFVGVIAIGTYFFMMYGFYVTQYNQNNQIIEQRSEEVAFAREIQSVNQQAEQNNLAISTLESSQYPLVYLIEDILATISDSEEAIESFSLNDGSELLLLVNRALVEDSANLIVSLEALPYTSRVQMNRLENQQEEQYLIDLSITIDEAVLREEAGE